MQKLAIGFVLALVAVAMAVPVYAQVEGPKIAIHIQPKASKNACTTEGPTFECSNFSAVGDTGVAYGIYLVVADGPPLGIAGAAFGISYDPDIGVFTWNLCADIDFSHMTWPASGASTTVTWSTAGNCQTTDYGEGRQGIMGWLYAYAYGSGFFGITPRLTIDNPDLVVVDCLVQEIDISQEAVGAARFSPGSTMQGCNPCLIDCMSTPVKENTWGKIKKTFLEGE